ncbi:restriction endonuclease [Brevibacillus humidisoli]|uniref:restriction endonuclease n=1 Tax=Brevibacillus humidisoli TaxID=2895522 RepID=UPI001E50534B|nr:restriction endonuclease [Brevibacillus humidisoli]UFJ41079.1 restriction endonuclease [Brevibacillus humidisoli]
MIYLLLFFAIAVLALLIYYQTTFRIRRTKSPEHDYDPLKIDINDIDRMVDGSEFEIYLYRLFLALGYSGVYKTVGSGDFGADLVFQDRTGTRNVIQAKRYGVNNPAGIHAVQEVFASMRYYKAKKAIVIATTNFTRSCETLAGINHVRLLDREELIDIIDAFKQGDIHRAKDIIEEEPRVILESWSEYNDPALEIKKDKKAEKAIRNIY